MTYMTVDKRGRGTLPEEVRQALGISDEGPTLVLLEKTERGTYELVPAAIVAKEQLWFHDPEMQGRISQGEADLQGGRSTRVESTEEAKSFLDSLKGG